MEKQCNRCKCTKHELDFSLDRHSADGLKYTCKKCCASIAAAFREKMEILYSGIYRVWCDMNHRCKSTTRNDSHRYTNRGISVCQEWSSFPEFYDWAILNRFRPGLELDRKDNDGGYCPSNCRFVTHEVNCQNRSTTLLSEDNVRTVRRMTSEGAKPRHISAATGIRVQLIKQLRTGSTWKNV